LILAHAEWRWLYSTAALMFVAGVMALYDEVVTPCE
jgi:hypothetical protein